MSVQPQDLDPLHGAEPEDLLWLSDLCRGNSYYCPQVMPRRQYAVVHPFGFTWAIIVGDLGDEAGYSDRWCFDSFKAAAASLDIWKRGGFIGEPQGWHRHPFSGRRRPGGNASVEYVNP